MMRGAIFDLDGTILDSTETWDQAAVWYLESIGIMAEKDLPEILFTMSMKEGAAYIIEKYAAPKTPEEIIAGVNHLVQEKYSYEILPKPGVVEFLHGLKEKNIPIVLATATDRELFLPALKRCGLEAYFTAIFTCTEAGAGKESPVIFELAEEKIYAVTKQQENSLEDKRKKRKDIWVFEDGLYAMKTAKTAGFSVAGIYDAISAFDQEEIKKTADVYGENWTQLREQLMQ